MASHTPTTADEPRPGGRPKVPRAVRERDMLRVAERAFAERGFHAASVDAIAAGAGISKPMVYAYFGSKEGLYRACMERARAQLMETIGRGAEAAAAPDRQLWLGILGFFEFVAQRRDAWSIVFGEGMGGPFAQDAAQVRRDIARLVGGLLHAAAAAEGTDPAGLEATEPLAHALIGAGESLAEWWHEHPEHSTESVALLLMNFAWMGLGDLVRGERWSTARAEPDGGRRAGRAV